MLTKLSASRIAAWRGLLTIQAKVTSKVETALTENNLPSLAWYDVLFALYEQPGKKLRMAELADAVLLSRSGLTRLVDKLEADSCLRREAVQTDKRGFYVTITKRGIEVLRRIWPIYRAGIVSGFSDHLSNEEINLLNTTFQKVLGSSPKADA
jgi:DNA-binding MarR family transcriptional regulator